MPANINIFIIIFLAILSFPELGIAAHSNLDPSSEAAFVRKKLEIKGIQNKDKKSIILPVSQCLDQGSSSLCWFFSMTSAIETTYLNLGGAKDTVFSRRVAYYWMNLERALYKAAGPALKKSFRPDGTKPLVQSPGPNLKNTRGTAMDAFRYAEAYGLVPLKAFAESPEEPLIPTNLMQISPALNLIDFISSLENKVGNLPKQTDFQGSNLSPTEIAKKVLQGKKWISYGVLDDSNLEEGWNKTHVDNDNQLGDCSYMIKRERLHDIVKKSLELGQAMVFSSFGHALMLYGASWDMDGKPLEYYIKDSYGDCFYIAAPSSWEETTWEITAPELAF